jgi:hypothetical protein
MNTPTGNETRSLRKENGKMTDVEQKIRLGIGSAAAAAAIFAPLDYKWKGVLTAIAADAILTGIYEVSPFRKLIRA